MRIYAFDFDGVLFSSIDEWAVVCSAAWKQLKGKEIMPEKIKPHRPFIMDAYESYGLMRLLDEGRKVTKASIKKIASGDPERIRFFSLFYKERCILQNRNFAEWASLNKPYDFAIRVFARVKDRAYIVTNKDKNSIILLLKYAGVDFDTDRIIANDISLDKQDHMKIISQKEGVRPQDIMLIDDAIDHLKLAKENGVLAALASWGYASKEDNAEARRNGMLLLDESNVNDIDEMIDVVDTKDNAVGYTTRKDCHLKGFLHRAIHVIVVNDKNEILLQKRSLEKDIHPGKWIDAVAGHVDLGETYEAAAEREMNEELGITTGIRYLFKIVKKSAPGNFKDNEIISVFMAHSNGPFVIDKRETQFVKFFMFEEIFDLMKKEEFTPSTSMIMKKMKDVLTTKKK